jgi:hypothetical protein
MHLVGVNARHRPSPSPHPYLRRIEGATCCNERWFKCGKNKITYDD